MVPVLFLLHVITMFLWSMSTSTTLAVASKKVILAKPYCSPRCGDVQIPYPFGIEAGCYKDDWFQILCDNSAGTPPTLYLNPAKMNLRVLNISVESIFVKGINVEGTVQVHANKTFLDSCSEKAYSGQPANLSGSPFVYSQKNRFAAVGCGGITSAMLSNGLPIAGCLSSCDDKNGGALESPISLGEGCSGINCCQTNTPRNLTAFNYRFEPVLNKTTPGCKYAFLIDPESDVYVSWALSSLESLQRTAVLLDWNVDDYSTRELYNRPQKPVDIVVILIVVSCVLGVLFLHGGAWWSHKVIKKRKNIKRKQKFFKQNGGLLLEQQSSSGDQTSIEKVKLFHSEELEKATDNYNADRILGRGGQGTVYKGMLADGKIVAVKKSLLANGSEVRQFINEIVILSQIIHRNVVKLWGCCLETEVPLLVYEFIPNGTLSHYIQHENEDFPLTWGIRLRVAKEVAGALSYLHSAASTPIYHRDIKSSNILLDDKYTVKVADFGTSRSVSIDKTHLTMSQVQGTFGYLDPEYFQTSQFTDKSDVYSFGVVLVELLTGKKPIFQTESQETMSLSHYFLVSMEENRLFDILDARAMNSDQEEVMAVANLAMRCLNMKGKERPAMKDVAAELEAVFKLQGEVYNVQQNTSTEAGYARSGVNEVWDSSTSVPSSMVTESSRTSSSFDLRPLESIKTE